MKYFLGTTFYTSLLHRKAPGTISSFFVFIFSLVITVEPTVKWILASLFLVLHFFCFSYFEERFKDDDSPIYTLDETLAMTLLSIPFADYKMWILAFLLFRFFDILKPLGIRKIESANFLSSAIRNIADDLMAALYTFAVLTFFEYVISKV